MMAESAVPHADKSSLCRLIVLDRSRSQLLLTMHQDGWDLPGVTVWPHERPTRDANAMVRFRYGITAYCLFEIRSNGSLYEVMETMFALRHLPEGAIWVSLSSLALEAFRDNGSFEAITSALHEIDAYASQVKPGPFARFGWMQELLRWAQEQVAPRGFQLTAEFCQVHASPEFALVRLDAQPSSFWFKAAGEGNRSEVTITAKLAELFPGQVPAVVAVHAPWSGWLMEEAEGQLLESCDYPKAWGQAAERFALLQISSLGFHTELLAVEAQDLRLARLMKSLHPFLDAAADWMLVQQSTAVPALNKGELRNIEVHIEEAASALSALGIPDSLGSLDLNPGNVVISSEGCVFLDWAAAYVGHPFLALEYLRAHFVKARDNNNRRDAFLTEAYLSPWHSLFPTEVISRAIQLTPLLAVFAYAIGTEVWSDPKARENQQAAGFLRSLVRRMQRESLRLTPWRAPCLH